MKSLQIILAISFVSILFSSCGEKNIEIEQKGETFYCKGTLELYSGTCTQLHENGKTLYHGAIEEGKKEGVWTWYYPDGLKRLEETFINGMLNGPRKGFNKNGKLIFETKYNQGLLIES